MTLKVGPALHITSELGLWLGRRCLFEVDSAPLLLDRVRDRGPAIRRQALIPVVICVVARVLKRLVEQRVRTRDHLLFRAFAEPVQGQLAPIGSA